MSETRKPPRWAWLGPVLTAVSGVCLIASQAIRLSLGQEPRWTSWVLLVLGVLVAVFSLVGAVLIIRAERRGRGGGIR